jgi:hypothetical protein
MPRPTPEQREAKRRARLTPFVPLLKETLDAPAWKALSHGARSLYVGLKRRYNVNYHNNGKLWLSQRDAAREVGSHHNEIARWYRELQFYGFIRMHTPGGLGVHGKGKAPHWRLTELGYMQDPPTREFTHWQGEKFRDRKSESRAGNPVQGVRQKARSVVPEMAHREEGECAANGAHKGGPNGAGNRAHTNITTPIASSSLLASRLFASSTSRRQTGSIANERDKTAALSAAAATEVDDLEIPPFLKRTHA